MPFTLSHAAAVLPVIRRDGTGRGPLIPSMLVAGSCAPDMTYFAASVLPGGMEFGDVTHSAVGVFTVDALIAAALVGVWRVLREVGRRSATRKDPQGRTTTAGAAPSGG